MLNEESICIIDFLGKKVDWENWSMKFLSHDKCKGYKKLLVSIGSMVGVNKISMQEEYENDHKGDTDLDKKVIK